jgi:hypothetical protein
VSAVSAYCSGIFSPLLEPSNSGSTRSDRFFYIGFGGAEVAEHAPIIRRKCGQAQRPAKLLNNCSMKIIRAAHKARRKIVATKERALLRRKHH